MSQTTPSRPLCISVWIAQVVLALLMLSGAILKWLPVAQSSAMMPWMGQLPLWHVRLLGVLDLLGGVGVILPSLLRYGQRWVVAAATGIALLMLSAIAFHISRGEASVIGFNVFLLLLALFIAWARGYKAVSK